MSNGITKNWDVVRLECAAYAKQVRRQWLRLSMTPWKRKAHVLFGLVPDAHRLMPRTLSYLALISVVVTGLVWWLV